MYEEDQAPPEVEEGVETNDMLVAAAQESLKECQEKYLRLLAESENARKRMQKERQETTKFAIENVLVEFLHPLDSFEQALHFAESTSDEVKNWALGFEMILNQLKQVLANHGVECYEAMGEHFNPHFHEAVEMVETDEVAPGTIVEQHLRGYKMGDRTIRVARVNVAKAPEEVKEDKNEKEEENG